MLLVLVFVLALVIAVGNQYSSYWFMRWYLSVFYGQTNFGWYTFNWLGQVNWWLCWTALIVVFGLGLWLALHVFRWTLARHAVRSVHLLRVVVLALIALVLSRALLDLVGSLCAMWLRSRYRTFLPVWAQTCPELVALSLFGISLMLGLSVHLRLRRGWLMGLLAALVTVTALTVFFLEVSVHYDSFNNPWTAMVEETWPVTTGLIDRTVQFLLVGD